MPIDPVKDGSSKVWPVGAECLDCTWKTDHGNLRRAAKHHIRTTAHAVRVISQRVETWRARWS